MKNSKMFYAYTLSLSSGEPQLTVKYGEALNVTEKNVVVQPYVYQPISTLNSYHLIRKDGYYTTPQKTPLEKYILDFDIVYMCLNPTYNDRLSIEHNLEVIFKQILSKVLRNVIPGYHEDSLKLIYAPKWIPIDEEHLYYPFKPTREDNVISKQISQLLWSINETK